MAWIKIIDEEAARGPLSRIYADAINRAGKVFNILKIQSQSPATLQASMDLYIQTMKAQSPLSRVLREAIATVVSKANNCFY
jgi:alkylhydroperoxidase family enzyme